MLSEKYLQKTNSPFPNSQERNHLWYFVALGRLWLVGNWSVNKSGSLSCSRFSLSLFVYPTTPAICFFGDLGGHFEVSFARCTVPFCRCQSLACPALPDSCAQRCQIQPNSLDMPCMKRIYRDNNFVGTLVRSHVRRTAVVPRINRLSTSAQSSVRTRPAMPNRTAMRPFKSTGAPDVRVFDLKGMLNSKSKVCILPLVPELWCPAFTFRACWARHALRLPRRDPALLCPKLKVASLQICDVSD